MKEKEHVCIGILTQAEKRTRRRERQTKIMKVE